jgi:hypothetical protein
MQSDGTWVEPSDATVVIRPVFTGRIVYAETGISIITREMTFLRIFPVTSLRGNAPFSGGMYL